MAEYHPADKNELNCQRCGNTFQTRTGAAKHKKCRSCKSCNVMHKYVKDALKCCVE